MDVVQVLRPIVLIAVMAIFAGCNVTNGATAPAQNVTATTAVLRATGSVNKGSDGAYISFQYGAVTAGEAVYTSTASAENPGDFVKANTTDDILKLVSGLKPATTYSARACEQDGARRNGGPTGPVNCAAAITFTTLPAPIVSEDPSVFNIPASIDATGATEVSAEIMTWFSSLPSGTQAQPIIVRFKKNGLYWVDSSLMLRRHGSGGVGGAMWNSKVVGDPNNIQDFLLDHVRVDLNGATLEQRTTQPGWVGNRLLDHRKRWGVPILSTAGATDVEIYGGTIRGSHDTGGYSPQHEEWSGIRLTGAGGRRFVNHLVVHDMRVEDVWGDFIYMAAPAYDVVDASGDPVVYPGGRGVQRSTLTDVQVYNNKFVHAGRHGMVLHGGTGVRIHHNEFRNVHRLTFDSEPGKNSGFSDVWIQNNTGGAGNLGYFQLDGAKKAMGEGLHITDNVLSRGHFNILITGGGQFGPRDTFEFRNNSAVNTDGLNDPAGNNLITIHGWDGVAITDNHEFFSLNNKGKITKKALQVGANVSNVTVLRNCWVNAIDNQC